MGKFKLYNIPLKTLSEGVHVFEYTLDNEYFKLLGDADSDVKKGTVEAQVLVKKTETSFELSFDLKGEVIVSCDRCLDDMPIEIESKSRLIVKFGETYSEESDEIVIIPEEEGEINVAWFLYEFITLGVPMKHVHAPGKCNKVMTAKYNKHRATSSDEDSDSDAGDEIDVDVDVDDTDTVDTDPRWDVLKGLASDEE